MRYKPLPPSFYIENRKELISQLKPNSVAVIQANEQLPSNADAKYPFRQNNDLFYLTGIDQEDTILLLAPDFPDPSLRQVLFLKETNDMIATWEGHKLTRNEGENLSGVNTLKWTSSFADLFHQIMMWAQHCYLYQNEYDRKIDTVQVNHDRFVNECQKEFPLHQYERLAPLVQSMRVSKSEEEVDQIGEALKITKFGFDQVLKNLEVGKKEYELQAEFSKAFLEKGSRGFAYEPIIAGGANSCILHYIENDHLLKEGDLVLMDIGAEYGNYNADITRTFPVSGQFSDRQKAVYQAVLNVKRFAESIIRPGMILKEYQQEVGKYMESELIQLDLLSKEEVANQDSENPLYRRFFMHGTSHFLGLDVHDVGSRYQPIPENAVLTVEPGIYVREEGLGIRLEDNILVSREGAINLSRDFPIEIGDVEDWIHENRR